MATFFLAPYPTFGTSKNRKSEAFQKKSPYYWWWAYLKRNQDYLECCAKADSLIFTKTSVTFVTKSFVSGGKRIAVAHVCSAKDN